MSFAEQIEPAGYSPTEHQVNFALCDMSQGRLASLGGKLIGPYCQYARTLPATISVPACECLPDISHLTQQIITDPCYWTPQLPYLYNFEGEIKLSDGTTQSWSHTVGFRRSEVEGRNLRLERRRIVLRGAVADDESAVDLPAAHEAEVALIIQEPSDSFLQQASECGVLVIADLRNVGTELTPHLIRLAWQPSVAFVLVSNTNPLFDIYVPHSIALGHLILANAQIAPNSVDHDWASILLVELNAGEHLPHWLANANQPVVVIRPGQGYTDLATARGACDRLQAELAPEFDLAGYFVAL